MGTRQDPDGGQIDLICLLFLHGTEVAFAYVTRPDLR